MCACEGHACHNVLLKASVYSRSFIAALELCIHKIFQKHFIIRDEFDQRLHRAGLNLRSRELQDGRCCDQLLY